MTATPRTIILAARLGHAVTGEMEATVVAEDGPWVVLEQTAKYGYTIAPVYRLCWSPMFLSVCVFRAKLGAEFLQFVRRIAGDAPGHAQRLELARALRRLGFVDSEIGPYRASPNPPDPSVWGETKQPKPKRSKA